MTIEEILEELRISRSMESAPYRRMVLRAFDMFQRDIIYKNISWLPKNSMINIIFEEEPEVPVTVVFCFIFDELKNKVYLMENVNRERGLDVPGGHIDPGETSIEALHREVLEEVGLSIKNVSYVGSQKIIKNIVDEKYPNHISCQNFYMATINGVETNTLESDSLERVEFGSMDFLNIVSNDENCYYKELYKKALERN